MSVTATFDFDPAEHYRATRAAGRLTSARYSEWIVAALALAALVGTVVPLIGTRPPARVLLDAGVRRRHHPGHAAPRRTARRLAARDASVPGPQRRTLDDAGYHSRGNGVALDLPWHAVARAVETPAFFFVFYNAQCAYYLPKRALDDGGVAGARGVLTRALGARAQLLG